MKKIISIFIVFIILISTVLTAPAHALAVEIIGGSYVAYAILAAALAAAGYTIATSNLDSATFQALLDMSGAEDIKAMITATQVYTSVTGRVFFNWSAEQWFSFIQWVNATLSSGQVIINTGGNSASFVNSFNYNNTAEYVEHINSSNGLPGYYLDNCRIIYISAGGNYATIQAHLSNAYFKYPGTYYLSINDRNCYLSPFVMNGSYPRLYRGFMYNGQFYVNNTTGMELTQVVVNNISYYYRIVSGRVALVPVNGGTSHYLTGTINFPDTYSDIKDWFKDCVISGTLVGDLTGLGIGDDVINPGLPVDVGIDDNYKVGVGIDAVPQSIDGSIDIPLNRYIETDLGPDVIDPYVDFTPWDDVSVPPDDVVPDIRLNPPADVTANPDTPWSDEQTFPLDYPIDTATDNLPPGNNPNPDPSSDDKTNRLKLGPLILSKFPFCLPWDLQHALKVLIAPAEAPVFTIPFVNQRLGINESLTIDLSFADRLAQVTRWFLSALWVVILILITSKIIWK